MMLSQVSGVPISENARSIQLDALPDSIQPAHLPKPHGEIAELRRLQPSVGWGGKARRTPHGDSRGTVFLRNHQPRGQGEWVLSLVTMNTSTSRARS
jgi:hypothetical protein